MLPQERETPHVATVDVCLAGVFVGRGETIPADLYDVWQRRLVVLGLERRDLAEPEPAQ